jgi:twinkle protein
METTSSSTGVKFYHGNPVANRGITEKTMRMYGYGTITKDGKKAEIASFYRDGKIVSQHLRGPNKTFRWVGDSTNPSLWGQNLWKDGGKRLIITEGEYDCMTVSQLFNNKWAVVSLPNGAAGAVKTVKDNLEFISSYKEVVLMFDMDEAGQEAAQAVAEFLPPNKCKIASLPHKDANECLMKNDSQSVITAVWEAQQYSPDEILHVSTIESAQEVAARVYPFPFEALNDFLIGQRSGELTLWSSGTGSGKSTIIRELIIDHLNEGRSVGAIMLEESPQETMDDLISLLINKPVRAIRAQKMMNEMRTKLGQNTVDISIIDDLTDEEYADARAQLNATSLYVYDHLGNNGLKNLCSRMEYMAVSLGVDVIVLDHITAAATGLMGSDYGGDYEGGSSERLLIDNIMKEFRALVSRTGVRIDVVSQLKKTNKAYEEGDRITLQDLRGSGSLSSVPNTVIGLERDRQNPDPMVANTTTVRVLKNRLTGKAGVATCLYYDHKTGRLKELDWAMGDDGKVLVDS